MRYNLPFFSSAYFFLILEIFINFDDYFQYWNFFSNFGTFFIFLFLLAFFNFRFFLSPLSVATFMAIGLLSKNLPNYIPTFYNISHCAPFVPCMQIQIMKKTEGDINKTRVWLKSKKTLLLLNQIQVFFLFKIIHFLTSKEIYQKCSHEYFNFMYLFLFKNKSNKFTILKYFFLKNTKSTISFSKNKFNKNFSFQL